MISINHFGRAGRLGNQIFQFALLFFLNKKKGYQINLPIVDCQFWKCFDLQNINISHHLNNPNKIFHLIKYTCLLLGISFSHIYKEGKLLIKISKNNSIIYDNFIWNKIKSIKKINNFTGNLLYIKVKSNRPYLSDIGFIS